MVPFASILIIHLAYIYSLYTAKMEPFSLLSTTKPGTDTTSFRISFPYYRQATVYSRPDFIAVKRKTITSGHFSTTYSNSPLRLRSLAASAGGSASHNVEDAVIQLPEGLKPELMPKHVAFIMDGNRRWAKNRNLPVELGHLAAGATVKNLATNCMDLGIKVLTVFAFSTENWARPKKETDYLMTLFTNKIKSELDDLKRHGLQLSVIGDKQRLPGSLQHQITAGDKATKGNKGMHFVGAINYSGRHDITAATKKIAAKVRDGVLRVEEIDEDLFEQHLETSVFEYPNPDLLIRTSGELRISNFMLWQMAYSELYFSDKLFPDFGSNDLIEALKDYQKRHRRYGGYKYT